jgi:hypothetical protein
MSSGNELGAPGLARLLPAIAGHAGLRSLGLADNAIDGPTMGRLARVLEGTGVLHVVLGRRGGARANVVDAAATDAWVAALRRGPPWATIDLRGVMIGEGRRSGGCGPCVSRGSSGLIMMVSWGRRCGPGCVIRRMSGACCRCRSSSGCGEGCQERSRCRRCRRRGRRSEAELAAAVRLMERLSQRPDLLAVQHPQVDALRRGVARVLREERREEARVSREARAGRRGRSGARRTGSASRRRGSASVAPGRLRRRRSATRGRRSTSCTRRGPVMCARRYIRGCTSFMTGCARPVPRTAMCGGSRR